MNTAQQTIADLVSEDYRRATVFKKYGIDFCCGGGKTLDSICEKRGLSLSAIEQELTDAEQTVGSTMRPKTWSPDFLADYIVNEHHSYVAESVPVLLEFVHKVARVHGAHNPELVEIEQLFTSVADELTNHMAKEEGVLFPYIKSLVAARSAGNTFVAPPFGSIRNPIRMMEHEHENAGDAMREIRRLSSDFTPPEHACNTYRVAFAKLEEFETDLHRHVHLENNILFPMATRLEEELSSAEAVDA